MNELENRVAELEAIVVVLKKRLYKLEGKGVKMMSDHSWFKKLKAEASRIKM